MANYTTKLQGSRVLIIGGSSGVGFAVAEALLANGALVFISSSSPEHIATAIQRLEASSRSAEGNVQGFICNLSSRETLESEVSNLFNNISAAINGDKLDHIVFTAGDALALAPLEEFTLESIQQAGMVRFFAPMIVAQHIRKHLKPGPESSYTLTTNGVPQRHQKNWVAVHSYLAGLNGMARTLSVELAPVRVNAVGLGAVDTELWNAAKEAGQWEELAEMVEKQTTTGKVGKAEDVAEAYLYLMKDHNCAGTTINTHGGFVTM